MEAVFNLREKNKSEEYIRRCMSTCKNKGPNYKVFIKEIMGN